jgi:hypothetical protein
VGFGKGLLAVRAAKTAEAIPMFPEALTIDLADSASHCFCCVLFLYHMPIFYSGRTLFLNRKVRLSAMFLPLLFNGLQDRIAVDRRRTATPLHAFRI